MPVYKKGKRKVVEQRKIIREKQKRNKQQSKRVLIDDPGWAIRRTPLKHIERRLKFPISNYVRDICKRAGNPIVIDWGCGEGVAINEIARKFPKAGCYGFSDVSYKNWNKVKKVKFIHATANDFFRYFKNESVDLVYSFLGLDFIEIRFKKYIENIVPKLKVGGKIVCLVALDGGLLIGLGFSTKQVENLWRNSEIKFSNYKLTIKRDYETGSETGSVVIERTK